MTRTPALAFLPAMVVVWLAACVPPLPGGTLNEPTSGTGGTAGSSATGVGAMGGAFGPGRGGGPATGGAFGPGIGGSAVTGSGGAPLPGVPPLVPDGGRPTNIAVNSTNIYWVSRKQQPFSLTKVSINGGPPTFLSSVRAPSTWVAADENYVYWSDGANGMTATDIFAMPAAAGAPIRFVAGTDAINRLAVGPDTFYWTTSAGTVMKFDEESGTPFVLASGQGNPTEIVVDATNVYWVRDDIPAIMKVGVSGGQPVAVTTSLNGVPFSLAVDATHAYWVEIAGGPVMRASFTDGRPELVVPTMARSLAVDASGVYWTQPPDIVFVGRPASTTPPRIVAAGGGTPAFGLVLDATSVYWIGGLGSIFRAPK